jgi:hypothetical protein
MNSRVPLLLIACALLSVFWAPPSFCENTSGISASNAVEETALRSTSTNLTSEPPAQLRDDGFDITTEAGITYCKCKIVRVESDGITFFHSKGVAKIPFPDLPKIYSDIYNYDPEQAEKYSLAVAKRQTWFVASQQKADTRQIAASQSEKVGAAPATDTADAQTSVSDTYTAPFDLVIEDSVIVWFPMNNCGRNGTGRRHGMVYHYSFFPNGIR